MWGSKGQILIAIVGLALAISSEAKARAEDGLNDLNSAEQTSGYLKDAVQLYVSGQYFKSARYAFAAVQSAPENQELKAEAYSWVTLGLAQSRLYHSASYFFIRTLQLGNKAAIQRVLKRTQEFIVVVGPDLLRKYLIHHTKYEDYDDVNRGAFLFALGKEALLTGDEKRALGYLNGIPSSSPLWPYVLQLKGTAYAILKEGHLALESFRECQATSSRLSGYRGTGAIQLKQSEREADDLNSRCLASEARTYYQMDQFDEAEVTYDKIPKASYVWPDILFEQAWNAFGHEEYNRTLGKLVSYKSPTLSFVYNSEVDVLRAQSYLALCLYADASEVINEFHKKYNPIGVQVKSFVEGHSSRLEEFYQLGKSALSESPYTKNTLHHVANRFVRGPYFQALVETEKEIARERAYIRSLDLSSGVQHDSNGGFPGFLNQVLGWRAHMLSWLGGVFVKNSFVDYYMSLLEDFDKISFIKLEILKIAKEKILFKNAVRNERARGDSIPSRKSHQYYWSFNGEFWLDELGDYIFGLESECGKT